jgi:hypothetical protein
MSRLCACLCIIFMCIRIQFDCLTKTLFQRFQALFLKEVKFWAYLRNYITAFLSLLSCYRYHPVTVWRPSFLNVIDRSLTLPQRDPFFTKNISLNMSLMDHVGSRWGTLMNDALQTVKGWKKDGKIALLLKSL